MIYDGFTFFNELELLELRLHELAEVVDKFVLVEAARTHTNQPKPLFYQENRSRFSAFHDKIIHVVVEDLPVAEDPWIPERFQRNAIARGLTHCRPDDFVLVSDLDEIPRASAVVEMTRKIPYHDNLFSTAGHAALNLAPFKKIFRRLLRKHHPFVWKFEQTLYRHFVNCRSSDINYGTRMVRFRDFSTANELRRSGYKTVENGGWHFTSMGGVERIRQKIAAFAHQEFNKPEFTDPQHLARAIHEGSPLFHQSERLEFVPLDNSFPRYLLEHPEKFSDWIKLV